MKKKGSMVKKKEEDGLDGRKKMKMMEDKREMEAREWRRACEIEMTEE